MPTKHEYNGWYNYETWLANLHFDDAFRDDAESILADCIDEFSDAETIRSEATEHLAAAIKEVITDCTPENQNGLAQDFINAGLREINYEEIANHYIADRDLWSAGWNMPGCMPDSDPAVFLTAGAAREYIADEIDRAAEDVSDAEHIEYAHSAETCRKGKGEFGETIGRYHYWVAKV